MIQRIQSLLLLLSAIFAIISIWFPFVQFSSEEASISIYAFKIIDSTSALFSPSHKLYALSAATILAPALSFFVIFLYSKRLLQIRISVYSIFFKIAIIGIELYMWHIICSAESTFAVSFKAANIFILAAILLDILAIRYIKKDEELVKSVDRIR